MKKILQKSSLLFGTLLIIYGVLLLIQHYSPTRLNFETSPTSNENIYYSDVNRPSHISIHNVGINLPLSKGKVVHSNWETTTSGISYLESAPTPGSMGNSIVYGHNWTSLFGNLTKVKPGDEVTIAYNDGSKKIFKIASTAEVSPHDVQVLAPSNDIRLTLYTCTGFLDSKRFVAVAVYQKTINAPSYCKTS